LKKIQTADEFFQIVKKKIICFGAGKRLDEFCDQLKQYNIGKQIMYIVDNDSEKWGSDKVCNGNSVKIISYTQMYKVLGHDSVIIITCDALDTIYQQIKSNKDGMDTECYFYKNILMGAKCGDLKKIDVPDFLKVYDVPKIPKLIHYCWFGKNPLPDQYKEWMKSWKKYCPEYEIVEWNESNYDISKNNYMKQAYDAKKWGFVPDYARLDIVYQHGGIYLDTDVELINRLDKLLYQDAFCGFQYWFGGEIQINFGLGFGAVKGFPMLKTLKDQYNGLDFIDKNGNINLIASPTYQSEVLREKGFKMNGEFQCIDGLTVYPPTVLCGIIGGTDWNIITDHTISLHHFDGSWLDEDVKQQQRLIREKI